MNVKLMVVPGKLVELSVPEGTTVLGLAQKAMEVKPGVNWVALAQDREVRVNKKKFSNNATVDSDKGYVGSIVSTPLDDYDVVLIITKIQGNEGGVLTCTINDEDYALETPDTIANVLRGLTNINPDDVVSVTVNGDEEANLEDLIGDGDCIEVELSTDDVEDDEDDDDMPVIVVDGESFEADLEGKLAAIEAILGL